MNATLAAPGTDERTRDPLYRQMAKFRVRIFGLTFALGVATGIVMEFEFGTNWATSFYWINRSFPALFGGDAANSRDGGSRGEEKTRDTCAVAVCAA